MAKTATRAWDAAEHLKTVQDFAAYLDAALREIDESGADPSLFVAALGDVARAKGMVKVAEKTGLSLESLEKALSAEGNPEFATVLKVLASLGMKLHAGVK